MHGTRSEWYWHRECDSAAICGRYATAAETLIASRVWIAAPDLLPPFPSGSSFHNRPDSQSIEGVRELVPCKKLLMTEWRRLLRVLEVLRSVIARFTGKYEVRN